MGKRVYSEAHIIELIKQHGGSTPSGSLRSRVQVMLDEQERGEDVVIEGVE